MDFAWVDIITSLGLPATLVIFLLVRESKREALRDKEQRERELKQEEKFAGLEEFCRTKMDATINRNTEHMIKCEEQQKKTEDVMQETTKTHQKLRNCLNNGILVFRKSSSGSHDKTQF